MQFALFASCLVCEAGWRAEFPRGVLFAICFALRRDLFWGSFVCGMLCLHKASFAAFFDCNVLCLQRALVVTQHGGCVLFATCFPLRRDLPWAILCLQGVFCLQRPLIAACFDCSVFCLQRVLNAMF